MIRFALALAPLVAVYALTLASADPADLAVGAVASAAVLVGLRRFSFAGGLLPVAGLAGRLLAFPVFAGVVLRDVAVGTWAVALVVLGLRPLRSPGLVEIPIGERSRLGTTVTALTATLSPGEVLVDVDEQRGVLLLHVIDAADPDGVRERHRRTYERHQRRVFP